MQRDAIRLIAVDHQILTVRGQLETAQRIDGK
jgi:hypothetical protein